MRLCMCMCVRLALRENGTQKSKCGKMTVMGQGIVLFPI